jgi:nicotinamide-nucleotide amidase
VRVEVLAVGTELLLGQIANTNAAWLGQEMAAIGVDSHFHQVVGDNHARIVRALRTALARSDGVIICGGLGPTQDDITREAIAEVMGVELVRDEALVDTIASFFAARGRTMAANNARQADVPAGARIIEQVRGTAPGLICEVGNKVVFAVPGVPYEMSEMFERAIAPELRERLADEGMTATIRSKVLRTWGTSESGLAEALDGRFVALEQGHQPVTIAFLASGIEGIKVRITAKGTDEAHAEALLSDEERAVREVLADRFGDIIFGVDAETMEDAIARLLTQRSLTLGVAESVTGGIIASRLVDVVGASSWFRGGIVSYASEVKYDLLGVPRGPVVSAHAAIAMATGAASALRSDCAVAVTGVAGPDPQDGEQVGTVFVGIVVPGREPFAERLQLPGDRARIRQYSAISALDLLRRSFD